MLLILLYLLLNYDMVNCDPVGGLNFYENQLPPQPWHFSVPKMDAVIRKLLKEKKQKEQFQRRANPLEPHLGDGLIDYGIPVMDVTENTPPAVSYNVEKHPIGHNVEESLDLPMFWKKGNMKQKEQNTVPRFSPPTPLLREVNTEHVTSSWPTPDPWQKSNILREVSSSPSVSTYLGHSTGHPDQPIESNTLQVFVPPAILDLPKRLPRNKTTFTEPTYSLPEPPVWTPTFIFDSVSPSLSLTPSDWISTTIKLTPPSIALSLSPPHPIPLARFRSITAGLKWNKFIKNPKDVKTWLRIRPAVDNSLRNLMNINVTRISTITEEPPELRSTRSTNQAGVNNKHSREALKVNSVVLRQDDEKNNMNTSSNENGTNFTYTWYPYFDNFTGTYPDNDNYGDQAESYSTAMENKGYYEQMAELKEGFMMFFLLEFTGLMLKKKEEHVKDVVQFVELNINSWLQSGSITWIGEFLSDKIRWIGFIFSEAMYDMEHLKNITTLVNEMLKERRTKVSKQVNDIITTAEKFYQHEEGERLLTALRGFRDYPDVPFTGRIICNEMMDTLMAPYRRVKTSNGTKRLIKSIEKIIKERFEYGHMRKSGQLWNITEKQMASVPIKRRQFYHARRWIDLYPRMRNMLPITMNQKRFKIIRKRHSAVTNPMSNMERPTKNDHYRRSWLFVHPYKKFHLYAHVPGQYRKRMV